MRYRTCCYYIVCLIVMAISGLSSFTICGQSWNRGDIGDSGCSAYFPYTPEWTVEFSDDSSLVWTGEVTDGDPWEIMTYTDEFNLAVMFMYGPADSFTTENRDFFFNSFRFPE